MAVLVLGPLERDFDTGQCQTLPVTELELICLELGSESPFVAASAGPRCALKEIGCVPRSASISTESRGRSAKGHPLPASACQLPVKLSH